MKYHVQVLKNVPYVKSGRGEGPDSQMLDLYIPCCDKAFPVLVFFHGGGFTDYAWTKDTYSSYCYSLAEAGVAVAAPNSRLFPEYVGMPKEKTEHFCDDPEGIFHDILFDGAAALAWVKAHLKEYGPHNGEIFLGGHSAGAWQSMMLLYNEKPMEAYGMEPSELKGCIFVSGQPTSHFIILYARGMDPRLTLIDDASPMYYLKSLPVPQLVTTAESEIKNRTLQTKMYLASLEAIEYEGEVEYIEIMNRAHSSCIVPCEKAPDVPCALFYDSVRFIRKHSSQDYSEY